VQIRFPDAPDRGDQTRSFDGHTGIGWVTTPRALLGEYQAFGSELDGLKLDAELSFPGQIKQVLTNLRIGYNESIDGKEVQVVQGSGPRGLLATLFFDKSTGLLVRLIRYSRTPIGRVPTQVDYYDYRDVRRNQVPVQIQILVAGWAGFLHHQQRQDQRPDRRVEVRETVVGEVRRSLATDERR
jgi:hypothetical protein